ncbi:MAG: helix-turn-helix domain-containing protein [Deltaproteobacteria bacterium]|nr:helix-turn-helix domain-containing protein [Deltaproteobacteria bacterium]
MDDLLSTKEAAALLGVGPTAVKRWADAGELACLKTAGGHRRFRRGDVEAMRRSGNASETDDLETESDRWIEALLNPRQDQVYAVEGLLLQARAQEGAWYRVAERLGAVLTAIGERWQRGELSVLDEHLASERLARAVGRVVAAMPTGPTMPAALLVTVVGDDHTLGLSLVELCLREAGWRVLWAGRATPVEEIATHVATDAVRMVAASASLHSQDQQALAHWLAMLGLICREHAVHLLLGGSGAWPEPPAFGTRIRNFRELASYLAGAKQH